MFEPMREISLGGRAGKLKIAPIRPSFPADDATAEAAILAYAEVNGMGMGQFTDGEVYLSQRGLAHLCGVQNAHIGTISRDWNESKPRILAIRARLARFGFHRPSPHRVLTFQGRRYYCYDMAVVQAILDYYALDALKPQPEARSNRRKFIGDGLKIYILQQFTVAPVEPIRFTPLIPPDSEDRHDDLLSALCIYVCGLCALSLWMANSYLEGLRQRAMNAPWNRLGLYLPLKAILEMQAEAILRMNAAFSGDR